MLHHAADKRGKGNDEVHAYEAFLNGKRVLPEGGSRNAQAAVRIQTSNTITLVLTGKPSAKVFVLITYDPRQFAIALADLQKGEEKTQTCDISSDSDIGHPTTVLGSSQ